MNRSDTGKTLWIAVGLLALSCLAGWQLVWPLVKHSNADSDAVAVDNFPAPIDPPTDLLPATANATKRASELANGVAADPSSWPTEAFSETATSRLKELAKLASSPNVSADKLDTFVAADFTCEPLCPQELQTVDKSLGIEVRRFKPGYPSSPGRLRGSTGLTSSLQKLFARVTANGRASFKIVGVQQTGSGFESVVYAEGGGDTEQGRTQWTSTWNCTWSGDSTKLTSISIADYEEIVSTDGRQPWLVDATGSILGRADGYREQLLYGMDYWVNKLEHRFYVNRLGHHGIAIADINDDGLEDIYVCQPGALPNRLYIHQPDGTAVELSPTAGVDFLDDTTSALFVDLDNDGDQDLAILTVSGGFLFANDGSGRFEMRATMPDCRNAFSLTAADFDGDGFLDLYVGRYWPEESVRGAIPLPVPYYDALNGGSNVLLKNGGDWNFTDVTTSVGLGVDNTRYTMAAAWEDYDNDGDQDLYVANDFGRNCLYRNEGGTFVNVAPTVGVEDTAAGMSVSWADYNHDETMDLYVGNMFSSAGSRITFQRQYGERFNDEARGKLQRLARGNSLFSNHGKEGFRDVSVSSAVTMGRWAWGSVFTDLNNDTWEDLVVANGHVSTEDTGDL